jgi:hypothetical protein
MRAMEDGVFIIGRWVLTFGVPLAICWYQLRHLKQLKQERAELTA